MEARTHTMMGFVKGTQEPTERAPSLNDKLNIVVLDEDPKYKRSIHESIQL